MLEPRFTMAQNKTSNSISLHFHFVYRLIFGFIALIMAIVIFGYGYYSAIGYFVLFLALAATVYREQWTITESELRFSFGVLVPFKTKMYTVGEIESLHWQRFFKGSNPGEKGTGQKEPGVINRMLGDWRRTQERLFFFYEGREVVVELRPAREDSVLKKYGHRIAELIGCELKEEDLAQK